MSFEAVCELLGGLALFLWGISLASSGLQKAAGGRLRALLALVARRRIAAAGTGTAVTVLVQSSSATAVMLVSLAGAGLLTLESALAVVLGADLGTTITVQAIAFPIHNWALLGVAAGAVLGLAFKRRRIVYLGRALVGFGLVFYGLHLMRQGVRLEMLSDAARSALAALADRPLPALLAAFALTAVIQSSAGTIALVMALTAAGSIRFEAALPMLLGANLGTCATGLLASIGAGREGRRVAVGQLAMKAAGVALLWPLLSPFGEMIREGTSAMGGGEVRMIANAHLAFNLAKAIAFLPFVGLLARLLEHALPDRPGRTQEIVLALAGRAGEPTVATLLRAAQETGRMAGRVAEQFECVPEALDTGAGACEALRRADDEIDTRYRALVRVLTGLAHGGLSPEEAAAQRRLLLVAESFEAIGDVASRDVARLADKLEGRGLSLSLGDTADLRKLHQEVLADVQLLARLISIEPDARAGEVASHTGTVAAHAHAALTSHFARLAQGVTEASQTSSIYTDLVSCLRHAHTLAAEAATAIARPPGREHGEEDEA